MSTYLDQISGRVRSRASRSSILVWNELRLAQERARSLYLYLTTSAIHPSFTQLLHLPEIPLQPGKHYLLKLKDINSKFCLYFSRWKSYTSTLSILSQPTTWLAVIHRVNRLRVTGLRVSILQVTILRARARARKTRVKPNLHLTTKTSGAVVIVGFMRAWALNKSSVQAALIIVVHIAIRRELRSEIIVESVLRVYLGLLRGVLS